MNSQTLRSQRLLACLGDASRFRVMAELVRGTCYVTDLAQRVGLSQSCTTRHLQHLEREGLVKSARSGRRVFFSPAPDPRVLALLEWALSHEAAVSTTGSERQPSLESVAGARRGRGAHAPSTTSTREEPGDVREAPATVPIRELEDFLL